MKEISQNDKDFIEDQLSNDEYSTDEEMIDFLVEQTRLPFNFIYRIVKNERKTFFIDPIYKMDWQQYVETIYN